MVFLKSAENFAKLKETVIAGKRIDVLQIDPPISPVLILGLNEEVRLKSIILFIFINNIEFNEIISELNVHFEEHKMRATKLVEASK